MLEVNLKQGRYEIVQFVTKKCSVFGEVRSIRLFLDSAATVVVEMSTMEQTRVAASKLDGKIIGSTAFIDLVQRPQFLRQEESA